MTECESVPQQLARLQRCSAHVKALAFHPASAETAVALLRDPGFQQRNRQHLHSLGSQGGHFPAGQAMQCLRDAQLMELRYPLLRCLVLQNGPEEIMSNVLNAFLPGLTCLTTLTFQGFFRDCGCLRALPVSLQHLAVDVDTRGFFAFGTGLQQVLAGHTLDTLQIISSAHEPTKRPLIVDADVLIADKVNVLLENGSAITEVRLVHGVENLNSVEFCELLAATCVQRLTIQATWVLFLRGESWVPPTWRPEAQRLGVDCSLQQLPEGCGYIHRFVLQRSANVHAALVKDVRCRCVVCWQLVSNALRF